MRFNALRTLTAIEGARRQPRGAHHQALLGDLAPSLGKLAVDVLGARSEIRAGTTDDYDLEELQRLFLWTRADTIYAGTNQIQRNIIAERALGMPREPRIESRKA
jgi:alkylation response protein AidB-like acyl-CoA dehydrogenase